MVIAPSSPTTTIAMGKTVARVIAGVINAPVEVDTLVVRIILAEIIPAQLQIGIAGQVLKHLRQRTPPSVNNELVKCQ